MDNVCNLCLSLDDHSPLLASCGKVGKPVASHMTGQMTSHMIIHITARDDIYVV